MKRLCKNFCKGEDYIGNLKGLGLFMHEVISLISSGKKETIEDIENHIEEESIVEYITSKYAGSFSINFDNTIYDNKAINSFFSSYVGQIRGNENRKYGVVNDEDGLLLLLSAVADKIEDECKS